MLELDSMASAIKTMDSPQIIFLGGSGRSGTNISKDVLSRHPEIASFSEYRFILDPDGIVDFYRAFGENWSPNLADVRLRRLERFLETVGRTPLWHDIISRMLYRLYDKRGVKLSRRQYHGLQLDRRIPNFRQHRRKLLEELVEFTYPARWIGTESYTWRPQIYYSRPRSKTELAAILQKFVNSVVSEILLAERKQVLIDDNPYNILLAKELLELVPTCKILHVLRDPRDVVASYSVQAWAPTDKIQAAYVYRSLLHQWFEVKKSLPNNSFLEYRLEDLVQAPELTIRTICSFIGCEYKPQMLEIDLGHSHSDRWKREFSNHERQKIQEILGDIIVELGYTL